MNIPKKHTKSKGILEHANIKTCILIRHAIYESLMKTQSCIFFFTEIRFKLILKLLILKCVGTPSIFEKF